MKRRRRFHFPIYTTDEITLLSDTLIRRIDFTRLQTAMRALKWRYGGSSITPTVEQIHEMIRSLLKCILEQPDCTTVISGGFLIRRTDCSVEVNFVPVRSVISWELETVEDLRREHSRFHEM